MDDVPRDAEHGETPGLLYSRAKSLFKATFDLAPKERDAVLMVLGLLLLGLAAKYWHMRHAASSQERETAGEAVAGKGIEP